MNENYLNLIKLFYYQLLTGVILIISMVGTGIEKGTIWELIFAAMGLGSLISTIILFITIHRLFNKLQDEK